MQQKPPINQFKQPLDIMLVASGRTVLLSGILLSMAVVAVCLAQIRPIIQCALLIAVLIYTWFEYRQWCRSVQWHGLHHDVADQWWLSTPSGQRKPLLLSRHIYVAVPLVIIPGHCAGQKVTLLIWRYQYPPDTFRRLCLYLRLSKRWDQ